MASKAGVRFRVVDAPDGVTEAFIADLSSRGVLLESPRSLRFDDVLKLELQLPELSVHVYAQVAWSRQVGQAWKAGLRFFGISEADEERLGDLVESSLKKRSRREAFN